LLSSLPRDGFDIRATLPRALIANVKSKTAVEYHILLGTRLVLTFVNGLSET